MFFYVKEKYSKRRILSLFEPPLKKWFEKTFKNFTLPQKLAIPQIHKKRNVLITAPTGSGKTLACFSVILNELIKLSHKNKLEDKVYCIYVSPLRALDRDIYWNLLVPLEEVVKIAEKMKYKLHNQIRINLRTGDTTPYQKQLQLKKPPHILITTPETMGIILGTRKFKERIKSVKWVIVDEIHELADSKRGVHLSLSMERLEHFVGKRIVRIGAGATLEPLEEATKFLVGYKNGKPRNCWIIDARFLKPMDIRVMVPVKDLIYTDTKTINHKMYELLDNLISKHTTTLVFTNTRSGAERVNFHLRQMFPTKYLDETTGVHHSSISREIRHGVEEDLKKGRLKACISSTSLELGIDIGYIDLVIQIGSPKSVSRLTQRIGRAGHKLHEVSKGRVICLDRDDLVECLVMVKKCYDYWLDKFHMPRNCLDVLAQHILGMAIEKKWSVREAFNLVRSAYPFKDLSFTTFKTVLEYLAGHYHTLEDYKVYGKIWYDEKTGMFGRRGKYARVIYTLNIGTIPDEVKIKVKTIEGKFVGYIEEGFLERLSRGDIFVLGGKTCEFIKSKKNVALVNLVKEKRPTIPSWFSEQLPLSFDLALEIGKFRGKIFKLLKRKNKKDIIQFIRKNFLAKKDVAEAIYNYFFLEYKFLKKFGIKSFPSDRTILIENVVSENEQNIVFHTLYGRRVNDALSRAFAYQLMKKVGKGIGVAINDNGFVLIIPSSREYVEPKKVIKLVKSHRLEEILRKALLNTELIKRKFRHSAARALMILRNYKGYEISVEKQQMNAERLIRVVKKIEGFPVLEETFREILEDFMDIENARRVLESIEEGKIKIEFLPPVSVPSPFAHNLFALSESDVVLMEDRKKLLLELHRKVLEKLNV